MTAESITTEITGRPRTNKQLELNLGVINVPTIAAIVALGVMLYNSGDSRARKEQEYDLRLDAIEASRSQSMALNEARWKDQAVTNSVTQNIQYRQTVSETNIQALNTRVDRVSDAVGEIREGVIQINAKLDLLLPLKKTELGTTPNELLRRNGR